MAIRTLFVDLGDVVVNYDNQQTFQRLGKLSGRSPEFVQKCLDGGGNLWHRFEVGLLDPREFYLLALAELGTIIGHDEFWDAYGNIFQANLEMCDVLLAARSGGVELITASNIDLMRFLYVKQTGALQCFERFGLSYEMKTRKPDPAFFEKLLGLTGSRKEECLFVDDRAENVEAAAAFGLTAVRYDQLQHDTFCRALRGFGVLP